MEVCLSHIEWKDVGSEKGEKYPVELRALRTRKSSGVYLIWDCAEGEIVYIGESHKGHLYKALTRHFQEWRDRWPAGNPERHFLIDRASAMVEWYVMYDPAPILWLERHLIQLYRPIGNVEPEENYNHLTGGLDND